MCTVMHFSKKKMLPLIFLSQYITQRNSGIILTYKRITAII